MTISRRSCLAAMAAAAALCRRSGAVRAQSGSNPMNENVTLPAPEAASGMPVEQILTRRRSVRAFDGDPLTLNPHSLQG